MRVSRQTVAAHRAAMVAAASRLFRARGIDRVAVAEVTQAAGLTHGGFYGHFASKDELAAEACRAAFEEALGRFAGADLDGFLRAYLSRAHRDDAGGGCPMVAFVGEMTRGGEASRTAWVDGTAAWIDAMAAALPEGDEEARRRRASGLAAMLVGGLALSRGLATVAPDLADRLLLDLRGQAAMLVGGLAAAATTEG